MAGREEDPAIARLCERVCAVVWAAGRGEALCLGFGARGRGCVRRGVFAAVNGNRVFREAWWWLTSL